MTQEELKQKRDEMAKDAGIIAAFRSRSPITARVNFKDGFDAAVSILQDENEKLKYERDGFEVMLNDATKENEQLKAKLEKAIESFENAVNHTEQLAKTMQTEIPNELLHFLSVELRGNYLRVALEEIEGMG